MNTRHPSPASGSVQLAISEDKTQDSATNRDAEVACLATEGSGTVTAHRQEAQPEVRKTYSFG